MDLIGKLSQCSWCFAQFSDPVNLPCGQSVCLKHTEELRNTEWRCRLCDGQHTLAYGEEFPVSHLALSLLRVNFSKLDFGPAYKVATRLVEAVESKYDELRHAINDPNMYVSKFTSKYRNQVDLGREEIIKTIDDVCDEMNKNINKYQLSTEANMENQAAKMIELAEALSNKIKELKDNLNELVVNEELWKKIAEEAYLLHKKIDTMLSDLMDPPRVLVHLPISFERNIWIELTKRLDMSERLMDKKSVLVRDLSKIGRARSWRYIDSETFSVRGFKFYLSVRFALSDNDQMHLGAYLLAESSPDNCQQFNCGQSVKLSWTFRIIGKIYQVIKQEDREFVFDEAKASGNDRLMAISDILAHPTYDPKEDMVRVEVVIDKNSV